MDGLPSYWYWWHPGVQISGHWHRGGSHCGPQESTPLRAQNNDRLGHVRVKMMREVRAIVEKAERKFTIVYAVADPGFPRGRGANSPGGAPTYDFAEFSQKLHEIERIWTPRGGARVQNFTMLIRHWYDCLMHHSCGGNALKLKTIRIIDLINIKIFCFIFAYRVLRGYGKSSLIKRSEMSYFRRSEIKWCVSDQSKTEF